MGVLGDEEFDSDGGQFCSFGKEFDSAYVKLPSMWYISGKGFPRREPALKMESLRKS